MADNDMDEDETTTTGMLIDETLSCNQLCSMYVTSINVIVQDKVLAT